MHIIVADNAKKIDNKIFLKMKPFKIIQFVVIELLFTGCKDLTITIINGIKNNSIVNKIYGKSIKRVFAKCFLLLEINVLLNGIVIEFFIIVNNFPLDK